MFSSGLQSVPLHIQIANDKEEIQRQAAQIQTLCAEYFDLQQKYEGEHAKTEELVTEFEAVGQRYNALRDENQSLKDALRSRDARIMQLEGQLRQRNDEYESLERGKINSDRDNVTLKDTLSRMKEEIINLRRQEKESTRKSTEISDRCAVLEKEKTELQFAADTASMRISDLQKQVRLASERSKKEQERRAELEVSFKEANAAAKKQTGFVTVLQKQLEAMKSEQESLVAHSSRLARDRKQFEEGLQISTQEAKEREQVLLEMRRQLHALLQAPTFPSSSSSSSSSSSLAAVSRQQPASSSSSASSSSLAPSNVMSLTYSSEKSDEKPLASVSSQITANAIRKAQSLSFAVPESGIGIIQVSQSEEGAAAGGDSSESAGEDKLRNSLRQGTMEAVRVAGPDDELGSACQRLVGNLQQNMNAMKLKIRPIN